jgi:hypothetical protein
MSGGYASSSVLLQKQADLKAAQAEYDRLKTLYGPQIGDNTRTTSPGNAMTNMNGPPPGIEPGEDFGQYWKAVKDGAATKTMTTCETAAAYDSRLFKKIVYTGDSGNLSTGWDRQCYGLIYNAPNDASYNNLTPSYYTTITPNTGYTKLGLTSASKSYEIEGAAKMYDLEKKIKGLVYDIVQLAPKATDSSLNDLKLLVNSVSTINHQINDYMNTNANDISNNYNKISQKQNRINVYDEINSQVELKVHKYRFFIYFFVSLILILGLLSYLSPLPLIVQITLLIELLTVKWWTGWGILTFVTILLILSSFGWDMRGNIMMVFRYITDPKFWTGELWWIGISLLLLIIVYLYSSFKQFFTAILPSSSSMD